MLTVLDPAIDHLLSQGLYRDQNLTVLTDCLELLPFSDDCAGAIARIEVVLSRFEHRPYQFRDLVVALGHSRSDAAVGFLLNLAHSNGGLQNVEDAWIEALGHLDLPSSRRALLSFVDPQIPWVDANIKFDHRNAQRFVAYVAEWARHDPALKRRLLELNETALTPVQKQLLPAIYGFRAPCRCTVWIADSKLCLWNAARTIVRARLSSCRATPNRCARSCFRWFSTIRPAGGPHSRFWDRWKCGASNMGVRWASHITPWLNPERRGRHFQHLGDL
jgi:hypothetical protein